MQSIFILSLNILNVAKLSLNANHTNFMYTNNKTGFKYVSIRLEMHRSHLGKSHNFEYFVSKELFTISVIFCTVLE